MVRRYSDDVKQQVIRLFDDGHTVRSLSNQFNLPGQTIRDIIRSKDRVSVKRKRTMPCNDYGEILAMNKQKNWQIRDSWEHIKAAKKVKIDGKVCEVLQVTDHHLTYSMNGLRWCINRQELYDNNKLVEVV